MAPARLPPSGPMMAYRIPEIPDPVRPRDQVAAGGDVRSAAWSDMAQVLRCIANLPPASASAGFRFVFSPRSNPAEAQDRLAIYLILHTDSDEVAQALRLLVERGPLARFFKFQRVNEVMALWDRMNAECSVIRREEAIHPLHPPEFHAKVPPAYYTIRPFEPAEQNDYLVLDRVLGWLPEAAVIDVVVSPADISAERTEHTRYLSVLESINRSWDRDDDEGRGQADYLGTGHSWHDRTGEMLCPIHRDDPLADDVLRTQRRFHETFSLPHLSFRIRISAETRASAELLASVLAESAFENGSYRIFVCKEQGSSLPAPSRSDADLLGTALPAIEQRLPGCAAAHYAGLARLAHMASVDELTGLFRLPVASCGSPCCIRKNTDPIGRDEPDLGVLGYDLEPAVSDSPVGGVPRGIPVHHLAKHVCIFGMPGSGKTWAVMNLAIQLHNYRCSTEDDR